MITLLTCFGCTQVIVFNVFFYCLPKLYLRNCYQGHSIFSKAFPYRAHFHICVSVIISFFYYELQKRHLLHVPDEKGSFQGLNPGSDVQYAIILQPELAHSVCKSNCRTHIHNLTQVHREREDLSQIQPLHIPSTWQFHKVKALRIQCVLVKRFAATRD